MPPIGERPMQYRELLLETVEPMDEADLGESCASVEDEDTLSSTPAVRANALDARLIRVIQALDR